jgi:CheY-like chemotaxis protein
VYSDGASTLQHLLQNSKSQAEGTRSRMRRTVVLLDNAMPVLTGVQVAELWRRFESAAGTARPAKICLVTASQTAPTPHLDQVILKPLTLEALRNTLR